MADLEFPKNTSSSTKETAESINKTSKANTDKIIKAIQIAMMANAQTTADEWYKKDRAKGITEAKAEQKLDKIGSSIKKAVSPVVKGLKEVGEKVVDSTKSAISDTYTEVFGSGTLAESIKTTIGASLKRINDTLTNIGGWLLKKGGKWLKNTLVYTMLFFGWLKKFLMKSMLFKAIGGIAKMAWGGITGVLSFGGDLLSSIAKQLVGKATADALLVGVKNMVKGLTWEALIGALAKLLVPIAAAALGWNIYDQLNTPENVIAENRRKEVDRINNLTDADRIKSGLTEEQWEEGIRREKARAERYLNANIDEAAKSEQYNEWIKQYPNLMRKILPDGFLTRDRNGDDVADYTSSRYNKAKEAIQSQYGISNDQINDRLIELKNNEELKNKSVLKNAAGVSST